MSTLFDPARDAIALRESLLDSSPIAAWTPEQRAKLFKCVIEARSDYNARRLHRAFKKLLKTRVNTDNGRLFLVRETAREELSLLNGVAYNGGTRWFFRETLKKMALSDEEQTLFPLINSSLHLGLGRGGITASYIRGAFSQRLADRQSQETGGLVVPSNIPDDAVPSEETIQTILDKMANVGLAHVDGQGGELDVLDSTYPYLEPTYLPTLEGDLVATFVKTSGKDLASPAPNPQSEQTAPTKSQYEGYRPWAQDFMTLKASIERAGHVSPDDAKKLVVFVADALKTNDPGIVKSIAEQMGKIAEQRELFFEDATGKQLRRLIKELSQVTHEDARESVFKLTEAGLYGPMSGTRYLLQNLARTATSPDPWVDLTSRREHRSQHELWAPIETIDSLRLGNSWGAVPKLLSRSNMIQVSKRVKTRNYVRIRKTIDLKARTIFQIKDGSSEYLPYAARITGLGAAISGLATERALALTEGSLIKIPASQMEIERGLGIA